MAGRPEPNHIRLTTLEPGGAKPGFLRHSTMDTRAQIILCSGAFPVRCKVFSSIPGLYSLGTSSNFPPSWTVRNVCGLCTWPLAATSPPAENHCAKWTELLAIKEQRVQKHSPLQSVLQAEVPRWAYGLILKPGGQYGCRSWSVQKLKPSKDISHDWERSSQGDLAIHTRTTGFSVPWVLTRRSD